MIDVYLSSDAWDIVCDARARAHARGERAGPDHLLLALLDLPRGRVETALEAYGILLPGPPAPRPKRRRLARLSPEAHRLVREAVAEAHRQGHPRARMDHLLYGALSGARGEAADELRSRGLTAERARELSRLGKPSLPQPERAQPDRSFPPGVLFAHILLVSQAGCCGCWGVWGLGGGMSPPVLTVWLLWTVVVAGIGTLSIDSGAPWVWAGITGFLGVRGAALLGLLALQASIEAGAPVAAVALVMLAVAAALFRDHGWFEIERRDRWRTLWRRGAWAIVPTLALDLGIMLLARLLLH